MSTTNGPHLGDCPSGRLELLTVGETMVQLTPEPGPGLTRGTRLQMAPGGAESNVAMSCAKLRHRTAWASRVGADPLSRVLVEEIASCGVDTGWVETDPSRPSGVCVKLPGASGGTEVLYYRQGSAASAMSPEFLNGFGDVQPRMVHLSGITAALSVECGSLVEQLMRDRPLGRARISFDVNLRPSLWQVDPAPVLRELAALADVVFVGLDEAQQLWGVDQAEGARAVLPEVPHLVVKDGAREAVEFGPEGTTRVPALPVDVVEPVGAGDAFAAGWLSGALRELQARQRLRLGHHIAAAVLRSRTDQAPLPSPAEIDELIAA